MQIKPIDLVERPAPVPSAGLAARSRSAFSPRLSPAGPVLDANDVASQTLFQSGWFVVSLLTQTLVIHMLRTPRMPLFQSNAAAPLTAMTGVIMAIGLWLALGPLARHFDLQALPPTYYAWLLTLLVGNCVLTSAVKSFYIRRHGWQ